MKKQSLVLFLIFFSLTVVTCKVSKKTTIEGSSTAEISINTTPSSEFLSPSASMKTMQLPEGYHLELVASEPMIDEPVAITWDGNGRMYVAEMITYMQDVDGTAEDKPVSKVVMLEDTDWDGKMDKQTIFIDSLILPRMILTLDDRLIVNETYSNNYYSYRDTDGDGKADEKVLIHENNSKDTRNLEHQKSGLIWNIDNWIYVTDPYRFRFVNGKLEKEDFKDPSWPFGQWGLANDNYGKIFYSMAGAELPALGFQQNPVYGPLNFKDQYDEEFQATWPIISTPDVQGGKIRLRADSTLNHFTACCGQSIFNGDNLPEDMIGDLFICEPVGRLLRRAKILDEQGKTVLKNAYYEKEFLASADMNFRPVNTATGPDGNLYIVDMYRGIIQESNWTKEGSYLRPVILRNGLDKNIGRGRIYRVVHDGYTTQERPKMLNKTSSELIQYLHHPNGWWRENAQKLIVIRQDKTVIPELRKMAQNDSSYLGRLHALWTLDGLNATDKQILFAAYNDVNNEISKAAIKLSEPFLKNNDGEVYHQLEKFKTDPDADVRVQLALSLRYYKSNESKVTLDEMLTMYSGNEMITQAAAKSLQSYEAPQPVAENKAEQNWNDADKKLIANGEVIFKQLCATCHGVDGKGTPVVGTSAVAPPLAGSERVDGDKNIVIRILLNGLTGPVNGKNYPDVMPPMKANDDEWIASVVSYVRNNFGNNASVVHPDDVKQVRIKTASRDKFWTLSELEKVHD